MKRLSIVTSTVALIALSGCGDPPGMGPVTTSDWESTDSSTASSSTTAETGETGEATSTSSSSEEGPFPICIPGGQRCSDAGEIETCDETGFEWVAEGCGAYGSCKTCLDGDELCDPGAAVRCQGPCDVDQRPSSSEGCSFFAVRLMFNYQNHDEPHRLIVANADSEGRDAHVKIWLTPEGTRDEELVKGDVGDELTLAPGETFKWQIDTESIMSSSSLLRTGGIYRVESDLPISAYMFAPDHPLRNGAESSLLLPEEAFRGEFVVFGGGVRAPGSGLLNPGYFSVIALEDDTVLEWTASDSGPGLFGNGAPIPAAAAGETVQLTLNRFDNLRISASQADDTNPYGWDVSGSVVNASKPVALFSGVPCAQVPEAGRTCDHLQEQVLPLRFWGQTYLAAAAPERGYIETPWWDPMDPMTIPDPLPEPLEERVYWRMYAGADDTTIRITPPVASLPLATDGMASEVVFANRGDWIAFDVPASEHLLMEGDRAFMPVQFAMSHKGGTTSSATDHYNLTDSGDPAMWQMVSVEQWLDRYAFYTTNNFNHEYVQITRPTGGDAVMVDGVEVTGFVPAPGGYEVANYEVPFDSMATPPVHSHVATSDTPFGLTQIGFHDLPLPGSPMGADPVAASYAHPGGVRVQDIFAP